MTKQGEAQEGQEQDTPAGENEGQEQGQEQGQGQEQPEAGQQEGGEEGQEAPERDPNVFDEDGKSWKSVAKEYQRKYNTVLEKVATQKTPETAPEEETEIPATRAGVKQVLTEIEQENQEADRVFNETVEDIILDKPEFAQYKDELHAMIRGMADRGARKNPDTIRTIARGLWGHKTWKTAPAAPKTPKKLVASKQSDVLSPSPKSGAPSEPVLTDAEQEYAEHNRFVEKGFSNEEIKDMFKIARKKTGG